MNVLFSLFRKDVDLTDLIKGMNRINVKSDSLLVQRSGESVRPIMILDFR